MNFHFQSNFFWFWMVWSCDYASPRETDKKVHKTAVQSALFINCYKTLMGSSHILKTVDWLGWKKKKKKQKNPKNCPLE